MNPEVCTEFLERREPRLASDNEFVYVPESKAPSSSTPAQMAGLAQPLSPRRVNAATSKHRGVLMSAHESPRPVEDVLPSIVARDNLVHPFMQKPRPGGVMLSGATPAAAMTPVLLATLPDVDSVKYSNGYYAHAASRSYLPFAPRAGQIGRLTRADDGDASNLVLAFDGETVRGSDAFPPSVLPFTDEAGRVAAQCAHIGRVYGCENSISSALHALSAGISAISSMQFAEVWQIQATIEFGLFAPQPNVVGFNLLISRGHPEFVQRLQKLCARSFRIITEPTSVGVAAYAAPCVTAQLHDGNIGLTFAPGHGMHVFMRERMPNQMYPSGIVPVVFQPTPPRLESISLKRATEETRNRRVQDDTDAAPPQKKAKGGVKQTGNA
jgi:hypothetical protein